MRRSRALLGCSAAALLLTLGACAPVDDDAASTDGDGAEPAHGGSLTLSLSAEVNNWNILHATGDVFDYRQALGPVYPHASYTTPDFSLEADPALVERVDVTSEDPLVVTYVLREAAVWSDGTPISADDFRYTWQVQDPAQCEECQPASTAGYDRIGSVEAGEDDRTVVITFDAPFQGWRTLFPHLLPAHIAEQHGDLAESFNEHFVNTVPEWSGGPFQIREHTGGQSLILEPNSDWYGSGPLLDELIIRFINEDEQAITALSNNEIEVISPRPSVDGMEQLEAMPHVNVETGPGLNYEHIDFNVARPDLDDPALRQAILTAIDRDGIVRRTVGSVFPDAEPVGSRFIMPGQEIEGIEGYADSVSDLGLGSGDADAAQEILEEAGYEVSSSGLIDPDGEPVRDFTITSTRGNAMRTETMVLVQSNLEPLGITVVPTHTDDLGGTVNGGDFDIILFGTNLDIIPTRTAQSQFSSASGFTNYADEEIDQWLDEAQTTLDAQIVIDNLHNVDARLSEEAVTLPLFQMPTIVATSNQVQNVTINGTRFGVTYNTHEWAVIE